MVTIILWWSLWFFQTIAPTNFRLHICPKFVRNFVGCNFRFLHRLSFSMILICLLIILMHLFYLELFSLLSFNLFNPMLVRYIYKTKLANTFNLHPSCQHYAHTSLKSYHHQLTHPRFHPPILPIGCFLIFCLGCPRLLMFQILMRLFGAKLLQHLLLIGLVLNL